jgi:hypothetical protein
MAAAAKFIAVSGQHACAAIWGDILAVCHRGAGWRNQLSRADGFRLVFAKRDAAHRADAQCRGSVLLHLAV